MNTILVPTDFSDLSNNALEFAVEMARYAVADVQAVHFVEILHEEATLVTADTAVVGTTDETLFNIQLMRSNKNKLQEITNRFENDSVKVKADLAGNGFLKGIQEFVRQNEVSAILIGTTGEQNLQEFFSGNHTEQLIEHLDIPVISIQKKEHFNEIKKVVMAFDVVHEYYSPSALVKMKDALLNFNARIQMVTVIEDPKNRDFAQEALEELRRRMQLNEATLHVLENTDVEGTLKNYVKEQNASAIALLTEAKSGLWRFVQGSLATHVTKDFDIPVLTLNKKHFE
ncbi:MAG: universal stress protein [Cytophagales bacterium]|nr:universal stress protein [Cytophagales bacterium]